MELGKDLGLAGARKINRTCTQEFIPIKDIIDGILLTQDNRYVNILELSPTNFAMKPKEEQFTILDTYEGFLKSAPKSFQIKCLTKQTQIDSYARKLEEAIRHEPNEYCKDMARDHANYLKELGRHGSVERHFYFIYEYEPEHDFFRKKDQNEILTALQRSEDMIKSNFSAMGNEIKTSQNRDAETAEFLYSFYNRSSINRFPFESRVNRIIKDSCLVNKVTEESMLPPVDVRDLVAPRSIDTTNADYILVDGMYRSHFFIRSNGYPGSISPFGWLSSLIAFGYGFDVDIFYNKESTAETLSALRTRLKLARLKDAERGETSADKSIIGNSIASMLYLMDELEDGKSMYNMVVLITVNAYTVEELYEKRRVLIEESLKMGITLGDCAKLQEEAFFSTGPYNMLSDKLYNLSHQNITSSAVRASYPFTNFALTDKNGKLLGIHRQNNSLVMYDIFDAKKYSNANMTIFGEPGIGKTYALLTITSRLRYYGIQNFILAPDKQDEFRRICDEVGGVFVDNSPGTRQRINPFDIWPKDSADNALINGQNYTEKSWLMDKIDNLKMWLQYLIPDITQAEKIRLEKAMLAMYKKKGITEDNNSIYVDNARTKKKNMPIFSDLMKEVKTIEGLREDIPVVLSQFVDGAAAYLNGQTNVDLENKYIVFGLEGLTGELQAPIMFLILEYVWGVARANKTKSKMIAIDEGWKLLDPRNPQVADFIIEIFKVIRGFGGGGIFSTQSILDLYKDGSNFGNAILACSHSNIILGVKSKELSYIEQELGLSQAEVASIRKYRNNGEALLCAGETHIPIQIKASKREHIAFTTRREELAHIAADKKRQGGN